MQMAALDEKIEIGIWRSGIIPLFLRDKLGFFLARSSFALRTAYVDT